MADSGLLKKRLHSLISSCSSQQQTHQRSKKQPFVPISLCQATRLSLHAGPRTRQSRADCACTSRSRPTIPAATHPKAIFLKSPIVYVSLEYMVFMKVYKSCILWFLKLAVPLWLRCSSWPPQRMGWFMALVLPCFTTWRIYLIKNLPNLSFTFLIAPILARYPSLSFNIAIEHHHFLLGQSSVGGRFPSFFCVQITGGYPTPHIQVRLRGPVIDVIEKFTLATRQLMN